MDKYEVKILSAALRQMNSIYAYIAENLCAGDAAKTLVGKLEDAIQSLEFLPERGAIRKIGRFANKGYRQLFVDNFTVVYRVHETKKQVVIVAVRYSRQNF